MAIGEQFTGIDMQQLISAPLVSAAQASIDLAEATQEFIQRVGFDKDGGARKVAFGYDSTLPAEGGALLRQRMRVELPLLAVTPVPGLQIDELDIQFDMEVKQFEARQASTKAGAELTGGAGFGPAKLAVTGTVASSGKSKRGTDSAARYHLHIKASNQGVPEGLAKVLDLLNGGITPRVVGTTPLDSMGAPLRGEALDNALELQALQVQKGTLEAALLAAGESAQARLNALCQFAQALAEAEEAGGAPPEELEEWRALVAALPALVESAAAQAGAQGEFSEVDLPAFAALCAIDVGPAAPQLEELYVEAARARCIQNGCARALEANRTQANTLIIQNTQQEADHDF